MMALTHATIALSGTSLILGTANPLALGLAVIGSQLPDLDATTSTSGASTISEGVPYPKVYPLRQGYNIL